MNKTNRLQRENIKMIGNLIGHSNAKAAYCMAEKARNGRADALASLPSNYIVTVTREGRQTRAIAFTAPPSIDALADVAPGHFIVAVRMGRRTARNRVRQLIAAE